MSKLYFLHGMESSPQGTKSRLIRKTYPNCIIPELPPDIHRRNDILLNLIKEPAWIIGSSLGGLSALLFAMDNPGLVRGMVLLAPAVGFFAKDIFPPEDLQSPIEPPELGTHPRLGQNAGAYQQRRATDRRQLRRAGLADNWTYPQLFLSKLKSDFRANRTPAKWNHF